MSQSTNQTLLLQIQPQAPSKRPAQAPIEGHIDKKRKTTALEDICAAIDALHLQDLDERISAIENVESRLLLKMVVYDWQTIVCLLRKSVNVTAPWKDANLTARFPIGLPGCQSLDPTLSVANKEFDRIAALHCELRRRVMHANPSEFDKPHRWAVEQREFDDLLCFRPTKRADLPLSAFHLAFGQYLTRVDSNEALPQRDDDARGAALSAHLLLTTMGNHFANQSQRTQAFNSCLLQGFDECNGQLRDAMRDTMVQITTDWDFDLWRPHQQVYPVILRVDKNEPGDGYDPYMRVARAYQEMVVVIGEHAESGPPGCPARLLRDNGVPALCLCISGPDLQVLGAFFDGKNYIVEPLGPIVCMLPDGRGENHRRDLLARVLYELRRTSRELEKAQTTATNTPGAPFESGVPRIYDSCRAFSSNEICPLTLISRASSWTYYDPFCEATWVPPGSQKRESVLVKLTDGPYGVDVQHALASQGYAPRLHAISEREGAPTAYIMDKLQPEDWFPLSAIRLDHPKTYHDAKPAIRKALDRIIDFLEQETLVYGDLRPDNIMVKVVPEDQFLKPCISQDGAATLIFIDFDWAGKGGQVFYPYERVPKIEGLTWPGVSGGLIEVGHDRQLVNSWFDSL